MKRQLVWIAFTALATMAYAQDWPQYMGPNHDGHSTQKNIRKNWAEKGPEVVWSTNLGIGYGGPVVKNGKVYLLDRNDEEGDIMRCYDLNTGKENWNFAYSAPGEVQFPGSRSVPVVDDAHVYSCGPYGDLYCFDVHTAQPVWNKNVWKDFGGEKIPTWAISQCPVLYKDLLIIASQAPQAGVVAYDKNTGEVKWKTPALGPVGYVSPTIINLHGQPQVVMTTASDRSGDKGHIVGLDPDSGKMLWDYDQWECGIPVATASDAGDNKILVVGGYQRGATMLKINKEGDNFSVAELFTTIEFGDQTKQPVLVDGYFYAQYTTNNRRDGLVCMDMEGNLKWKTRRAPLFNRGSIIYADGVLLATDGAKSLFMIQPDGTEYKELGKVELLVEQEESKDQLIASFGTQNWAPMALADGYLLMRDQTHMICVKIAD